MFRSNEEVYSLVKAFEDRTLPKSEWTHEAYLAVAYFYCTVLPFAVARNVMRDGIYWLNDRYGTANTDHGGYHETLTVFWLKQIWNLLDSRRENCWNLAEQANEIIKRFNDPTLPLNFYSRELLFSAEARRDYHPPDLRSKPAFVFPMTLSILRPLI